MDVEHLGRRRLLSGGLAFASACVTPGLHGHEMTGADAAKEAAPHAPFRAAFLSWLGEASGRCALPVVVDAATPFHTGLCVSGLHPGLDISLAGNTDINVFVTWHDVCWDILASMDVYATAAADGSGWWNDLLVPEARCLHPTREACWREDGFKWLLRWLNDELALATHLALYGGDGCYQGEGWTAAYLVRDGVLLHTGRQAASNGPLRELLPLYATEA